MITNSTTGVKKTWPISDSIRIGGIGNGNGSGSERPSAVTNIVAKTLQATKDEVYGLWKHPGVMRLLKDGKLRLEESAAL